MGDRVQVTSSELTSKAQTVNTPRSQGPGPAQPPDGLEITVAAMQQLAASAESMAATLSAGDVEAQRIGASLTAAAGAYDKVDAQRKAALDGQMNGGDGSAAPAESVVPDVSAIPPAPNIPCFAYPDSANWDVFTDWQTAARTIHSGDTQALSVKYLRDQWKAYKQSLHDHAANFAAPPAGWEGGAAEACEGSMKSLYSWWLDMGDECDRLGQQAETLADAHDKLVADHPTMEDVENFNSLDWSTFVPGAKSAKWAWFQGRSELALRDYANGTDMMQIRPGKPPSIGGLPAVNSGDVPANNNPGTPGGPGGPGGPSGSPSGAGGGGGGGTPEMPKVPSMDPSMSPASADPSAGQGQESGSPSGGSPSGGSPSGGAPAGGGAPGGSLPSGLPDGTPDIPGLDDPSLQPASAGGGGGGVGGGGGGMGGGPMGPAVGAETVAASPSGGRGAGAGPAGAPGGAGTGGMGGGMGGMGGGHGQGGQGKDKRRNPNLSEDEDLYVEDRAYTEAVIGRRARPDAKDTKK